MLTPIHSDAERSVQPEVAHAAAVAHGRLCGEPRPVHGALTGLRVDREIPDAERHQVLKKMRALRRRDPEIMETGLHDRAGPADLIPHDRHAESWLTRTQPADDDQQIR